MEDYTLISNNTRNINIYVNEKFPYSKEISSLEYNIRFREYLDNIREDTHHDDDSYFAFSINEVEYFCITLNPGLNSERTYYGKRFR